MSFSFLTELKPSEAIKLQEELRDKIQLEKFDISKLKYVIGADISLNRFSDTAYTGFVVLSYPDMKIIAHSLVCNKVSFPYIPGLLSFREIPPLLEAWDKIQENFTSEIKNGEVVIVMDGQGIAHPRRLGIATHFGLVTDVPTIGCAKNKLFGIFQKLGMEKGKYQYLMDGEEKLGVVLRTRNNTKPVFISPGHLTDVESSLEILSSCQSNYRIPEPTRLAHITVNRFRKGELQGGFLKYEDSGIF